MINLDPKLKERLDNEQNAIIKAKERKILVSAGPGSGKTYTLVKKIINELNEVDQFHGIIACSFTQLASKQLEDKLKAEIDIKKSFIGTIDSFLIREIFTPFKNRFRSYLGENHEIDEMFHFTIPEYNSEANRLTKLGLQSNYINYINHWKKDFCDNKYEISFASYMIALDLIESIPEAQEYLSLRYSSLYIDEAQDLNEFQIYFIRKIIEKCKWKCCLIGDKNQSIYEFRGAKPELFYNLITKGFKELKIDVSVRCHESILEFSNCFIGNEPIEKKINDNRVEILEFFNLDFFKRFDNLPGDKLILFEKNEYAKYFYEWARTAGFNNYIYTVQINIKDKDFSNNNLMIINEILYFFYNFNIDSHEYCYSIDDFQSFLSTFIVQRKLKKLKLPFGTSIEYIEYIYSLMQIPISKNILDDLKNQLSDPTVVNYYKRKSNLNKIMTIHASKGLEANSVMVSFDCTNGLTNEYKRKLFVSFTRAKEHLYIRCKNPKSLINDEVLKKMRLIIREIVSPKY